MIGKPLHSMLKLACAGTLAVLLHGTANAQAAPRPSHTPSVSVLYQATRANAAPGQCGCFWLNGGAAQLGIPLAGPLSLTAEVAGGTASQAYLRYDVTLFTYTAGPELRLRRRHLQPFAEALFGAAHGSGMPFGNTGKTTASSFALVSGGGLDLPVSQRFSVRLLQADYVYTVLPNTTTDRQNNLRLAAGVRIQLR